MPRLCFSSICCGGYIELFFVPLVTWYQKKSGLLGIEGGIRRVAFQGSNRMSSIAFQEFSKMNSIMFPGIQQDESDHYP
jgi:hypothetical protein